MTVGGVPVHAVAGDIVRPVGVFGGWSYVIWIVGAADPAEANSFQLLWSVDSLTPSRAKVCVVLPAATSAATVEAMLKPTPAAGQLELYPCATVACATTPPRLTPAQ